MGVNSGHCKSAVLRCVVAVLLCVHNNMAEDVTGSASPGVVGYSPETTANSSAGVVFYIWNTDIEEKLELTMDSDNTIMFNYALLCNDRVSNFTITVTAPESVTMEILGETNWTLSCINAAVAKRIVIPSAAPSVDTSGPTTYVTQGEIPVRLSCGIIGRTSIMFELHRNTELSFHSITSQSPLNGSTITDVVARKKIPVNVVRRVRPVDVIFRLVVYCVQIFVMTGFGAKLDLNIVKENLWRPIAPAIGLSCQYILMPLIAFTVAKSVPIDNDAVSLGIFVSGVCPGGGGSNMYSYLLQGDLSLSITMTALSTIAAIAMMPLWVYTLGKLFDLGEGVSIPFHMVAVSLSILILPLVFGVFLRQKHPKIADRVQRVLKPVIVVMCFLLLVVGIYSNLYIFRLFKPRIVLAACLLPYVGYIIGGIVAAIFRQGWKKIKTIGIETGMQNTSIGYILLTSSFPAPDGDIAAVGPVASAVMTPLPPFIITIIYLIYQRCKKKYSPVSKENDDEKDEKVGAEMKELAIKKNPSTA